MPPSTDPHREDVPQASRRLSVRGQSRVWIRLLRPTHWVKNALLGVPLITAQAWTEAAALRAVGLALVAFSLVASATYIFNDLVDLAFDQAHTAKRARPIASGDVGRGAALALGLVLLGLGLILACLQSAAFAVVTGLYVLLTTLYTQYAKRVALLDVLVLAALWTVRLWAGAVVIGVELSVWLLSFSAFLFLSLSILKRCAELIAFAGPVDALLPGRGYQVRDLASLQSFGIGTAVVSVLVLALFVDSHSAAMHYPHPERLWLICPAIWFWLARLWLETSRGQMHYDPVVFSVRDRASWLIAVLVMTSWGAALVPI